MSQPASSPSVLPPPDPPSFAAVGALIGDPIRAAILLRLTDGSRRPASELAPPPPAPPPPRPPPPPPPPPPRPTLRLCLDWTERRHHLGGHLGAALAGMMMEAGYLRRRVGQRVVDITPGGAAFLARELSMDLTP